MNAVVHSYADMEDPSRGESTRAPTSITTLFDKEVDTILAHRVIPKRGTRHIKYLVKWKGHLDSKASWEHEESLWQFVNKIADSEKLQRGRCQIRWGRMLQAH